jgi:hypothetical protein
MEIPLGPGYQRSSSGKDGPFTFEQGKTELGGEFRLAPGGRYVDVIATSAGLIQYCKMFDKKCDDGQPCNMGFTINCWRTNSRASPDKENSSGDADDISCAILARTEVRCFSRSRLPAYYNKASVRKENFHSRVLGLLMRPSEGHLGCYERIGFFPQM